jgi:acyl carrier protein
MLADLIAEGQAQAVVFPVDWSRFAREMPGGRIPSMLKEVLPRVSETRPTVRRQDVMDRLRRANPRDREAVLADYVRGAVAWVLGSASPEDVDPTRGFWTIGLDSLLALQLRNRLQDDLGCSLPGTLTMDHPNVAALSAYLIRRLGLGSESASPPAATPRPPRVREAATDLDRLSESEAEALLIERLQELEG